MLFFSFQWVLRRSQPLGWVWVAPERFGRLWDALGGLGEHWEALGDSGKLWGSLYLNLCFFKQMLWKCRTVSIIPMFLIKIMQLSKKTQKIKCFTNYGRGGPDSYPPPPPPPPAIVCKTLGFLSFLGQLHAFDKKHWDYWDSIAFLVYFASETNAFL